MHFHIIQKSNQKIKSFIFLKHKFVSAKYCAKENHKMRVSTTHLFKSQLAQGNRG